MTRRVRNHPAASEEFSAAVYWYEQRHSGLGAEFFDHVTGRDDPIFPVAHTQAAFEQLAQVYRAAGVPDRCELYIGDGGHRYYKERVWPFIAEAFAAIRTPPCKPEPFAHARTACIAC